MMFVWFPIDVMWLDENMKIVDFQTAEPFSWKLYIPAKPAVYVLEASAGSAKKLGLRIGDRLKLS